MGGIRDDGGGGGGGGCNDTATMCQMGFGGVIHGNNIFDAVAGAPGTYIYTDTHGGFGFGFSQTLWSATNNVIDALPKQSTTGFSDTPVPGGPVTVGTSTVDVNKVGGWQVYVNNNGLDTSVSGFVPDLYALANQIAFVNQLGHQKLLDNIKAAVAAGVPPDQIQELVLNQYWQQMQPWFNSTMNQLEHVMDEASPTIHYGPPTNYHTITPI